MVLQLDIVLLIVKKGHIQNHPIFNCCVIMADEFVCLHDAKSYAVGATARRRINHARFFEGRSTNRCRLCVFGNKNQATVM